MVEVLVVMLFTMFNSACEAVTRWNEASSHLRAIKYWGGLYGKAKITARNP